MPATYSAASLEMPAFSHWAAALSPEFRREAGRTLSDRPADFCTNDNGPFQSKFR